MMASITVEEQIKTFDVSIVIPIYNRETYLLQTLKTVVEQDYRPLQLILVDNASTDSSLKLCYDFQHDFQTDDFKVIVTTEERKGAACARNRGLSLCQSEYVYFFDSDDKMSSDFISSAMAAMHNNKELDVLAVKTMMQIGGKLRVRDYSYSASPVKQILMGLLSTISAVYRTSFVKSLGGWNEYLLTWDDWELGLRVLLARPRLEWYRRKAFHQVYIHDDSITGKNFTDTYQWVMRAINAAYQAIEQQAVHEERNKALQALYYRQVILAANLSHEGNNRLARECLSNARSMFSIKGIGKYVANILFFYTSHGGKGAWRIALSSL